MTTPIARNPTRVFPHVMLEVAENVEPVVVPGAAHWVDEQAPAGGVAALEAFLTA